MVKKRIKTKAMRRVTRKRSLEDAFRPKKALFHPSTRIVFNPKEKDSTKEKMVQAVPRKVKVKTNFLLVEFAKEPTTSRRTVGKRGNLNARFARSLVTMIRTVDPRRAIKQA